MLKSRLFEKDRAVQERWYRMKYHLMFGGKLKKILFWRLHRRLQKQFLVTDRVINQTIETTVKLQNNINGELFPETKQLFNIGLYFLLAERDIQAVKADAFAHPNRTKRNIALRTLLLTVYEWDMGKVTGKRMNSIYQVTGMSNESKCNLVSALKELRKARKGIERSFSETRHNTIAHREPDAMKQYEIIEELDIDNFKEELVAFYSASDALLKAMVVSLTEVGAMPSLFRQVVNKGKAPNNGN